MERTGNGTEGDGEGKETLRQRSGAPRLFPQRMPTRQAPGATEHTPLMPKKPSPARATATHLYPMKFVSVLILVLSAAVVVLHLFKQRRAVISTAVATAVVLVALVAWAAIRLRGVGASVITRSSLHRVVLLVLLVTASVVQVAIELALSGPKAERYRLYGSIAVASLALVLVVFVWLL